LPCALAQYADLLAELLGNFHHVLTYFAFTSYPLIIFVPGLDHQRRNNRQNNEQEQSPGQTNADAAPEHRLVGLAYRKRVSYPARHFADHRPLPRPFLWLQSADDLAASNTADPLTIYGAAHPAVLKAFAPSKEETA
jgi:hypothetical protein